MNFSAWFLCQGKAEEGSDAVASLTDDNAALAQKADAEFTVISAMQYQDGYTGNAEQKETE